MSRSVATASTSQTIVFWCFDSTGAAVTLTSGSAGLALAYRLDNNGREGTPVSITATTRDSAGVWKSGAITSMGSGKHEVDLPNAALTSAGELTITVAATGVSTYYVENILVGGALVGSLATQAKADVNAEVVDALSTDTYAELSAPPAATSSLKDKLTYVFQWLRNKSTQTSSQRKLYADDGTTVVATETTSDDGTTYTKGEAA